jgi:hypothetical protein
MRHCVETICRIVASGSDDRRAVFQLGYNLGRLSELTGGGRERYWDRWKEAVAQWDQGRLLELASALEVDSVGTVAGPHAGAGAGDKS